MFIISEAFWKSPKIKFTVINISNLFDYLSKGMIGKVNFTRAQLQWLTIYIDSRYKYSRLYIALSEISLKFEKK